MASFLDTPLVLCPNDPPKIKEDYPSAARFRPGSWLLLQHWILQTLLPQTLQAALFAAAALVPTVTPGEPRLPAAASWESGQSGLCQVKTLGMQHSADQPGRCLSLQ